MHHSLENYCTEGHHCDRLCTARSQSRNETHPCTCSQQLREQFLMSIRPCFASAQNIWGCWLTSCRELCQPGGVWQLTGLPGAQMSLQNMLWEPFPKQCDPGSHLASLRTDCEQEGLNGGEIETCNIRNGGPEPQNWRKSHRISSAE